jgi:lipopolysaccharide/colanic/teichoic acid biosynthesis glycosyltransferase
LVWSGRGTANLQLLIFMGLSVEIASTDTSYVDSPTVRGSMKARSIRLRRTTAIPAGVLPFPEPAELVLREEHVGSFGTPAGSDLSTRVLNVAVAAVALILVAPLFFLIAAAIKLTSRGPVLYKQMRIGIDRRWSRKNFMYDARVQDMGGRPFTMYKFRTMVNDAEKDNREVWATPCDTRVTSLGRFLRAARLDELPQLLNVLAGNMNIVGPRPERPSIFAELREQIPNYHLRQRVMPGITGWAQVHQSYDTCLSDVRSKVQYDLEYLHTRSVVRDLSIMARTVPIMLLCRLGW